MPTPVSKGPFYQLTTAGGTETDFPSVPTKLRKSVGGELGRQLLYLRPTFTQAVQSDRFAFMVLHATAPKTLFPPPTCSRRSVTEPPCVVVVSSADAHKPFVQTSPHLRTFHHAVPSPFFLEIELTENQCRSVSRSAVPRGCWV